MRKCDECDEPAIKSTLFVANDGSVEKHHCYIHAIQENLIEAPLNEFVSMADAINRSPNAIAFIYEAIHRADEIKTAQDICLAVRDSAEYRFGSLCHGVLHRWTINTAEDIGMVTINLMKAGAIPLVESVSLEDFRSLNNLFEDTQG